MATDHDAVIASGQDGLDKTELAQAAGERLQLVVADPARVGRIRVQPVDRDILDGEEGSAIVIGSGPLVNEETGLPGSIGFGP